MDANIGISDSLKVEQNQDGTFTLEWDKNDPQWNFLNGLTSKEITAIIEQAITMEENGPLPEG
tara:strand:+ start:530 stop:718 length:189 start_codon:yes stop_codon:yes gene_type:complete